MCLANLLTDRFHEIEKYLFMGYASHRALIARVVSQQGRGGPCADEQLWTLLAACGYAAAAAGRGRTSGKVANGRDAASPQAGGLA